MHHGIIIVGAGQAACQLIASLRQLGYDGALTLVGAEPHLPYQRPPLSKACLREPTGLQALLLRPPAFFEACDCTVIAGCRVEALDVRQRQIRLQTGQVLGYGQLVLATGARARRWPQPASADARILTLRSFDDSVALQDLLGRIGHLAILGAGYVGLEVAASARSRGLQVSVFESAPRAMQRSVGVATSDRVEHIHRERGVQLHLDTGISGILPGESIQLHTSQGLQQADALVIGIGAQPRTELARQAGLDCATGILVNASCRSSDAHVHAIGDCAEPLADDGAPAWRLESVQNAVDQAKCLAAVLCGKPAPAAPVPWFWSDQYGHRIQVAGRAAPGDEAIVRSQDGGQATWYLRDRRVTCIEALDAPQDFMAGRQLIRSAQALDPALLRQQVLPLKELSASPFR